MASLTITSGGSQPVFATDTLNGPQLAATAAYTPAGTPTNFMGPKLDFFGMDLGADPSTEAEVNGMLQTLLQTIQQTATVAMYQVSGAQNANIVVAVYPTAAYTTTTLVAAAQTANASGGVNIGIPTANVFAQGTFITQGTYYV